MPPKIYTKTGDEGETSLIDGTRIPKSAPQIDAYGTVDELGAHVALVRSVIEDKRSGAFLERIQSELFILGSLLAIPTHATPEQYKLPILGAEHVHRIEQEIDFLNIHLPFLQNFILPPASTCLAQIHIARVVCRRAERQCVAISTEAMRLTDPPILQYLNRLSDYFFVLARYIGQQKGIPETIWKGA